MMPITHVRVTNNNDFTISDRFDGDPYIFLPGKSTLLPVAAAATIFGFMGGETTSGVEFQITPDWAHVQRRYGWNILQQRKDEDIVEAVARMTANAKKWCDNITLEPVTMALREVKPTDEELPPPREVQQEVLPPIQYESEPEVQPGPVEITRAGPPKMGVSKA